MTLTKNLAIVFPGQGSQSVGMLSGFSQEYPQVRTTFAEASEALGYDLWDLVQNGPESRLNQTEYTQPALLAADIALWRLWQAQQTAVPAFLAGHSLGEYAALVAAQALSFVEAIKLVALRGKFMQEAVAPGQGAMAAIIGLEAPVVEQICQEAAQGEMVAPANFNSLEQTVIAGQSQAVERAIGLAEKANAKLAKLIPVSVPSHCMLMKPAAERLADYLSTVTINAPQLRVINNVDVACESQPEAIRAALVRQLYKPVRWVETIQFIAQHGVTQLIECGPGKVLAGLNRRIANIPTLNLNTPDALKNASIPLL